MNNQSAIKWDELSKNIQENFLMDGHIELLNWYFSDLNSAVNEKLYSEEVVNGYLERIKNKKEGDSYGITDIWLYNILERHNIKDKRVAIMGSISPWYESVCLYYGGIPTTIEYNVITPSDKRLKMIHINDVSSCEPFDFAFSISTFEHDGLGRYGDPINPDGDFNAMRNMKKLVKKDGILFLAVPVGKDKLVWNAHRKYGRIRLPYLIDEWEIIDCEGYNENMLDQDSGVSGVYQPIFALKNV
jgi:hypothetical protein